MTRVGFVLGVLAAATTAFTPAGAAPHEPAGADDEAPVALAAPRVPGLVVRVHDMDEALEFYRDLAGFEVDERERYPESVELSSDGVELVLERVPEPVRHDFGRISEAHLNLQVESLEATLEELERRGIRQLWEEPRRAAIGPNMPFLDPSGNILYVVELDEHEGSLPGPRVFNFGITLSDMDEAREFYEGDLGFSVLSESYYPPVIPLTPSGELWVVLHESASEASTPPPPDRAQMNLILAVENLDSVVDRLTEAGVEIRQGKALKESLGRHVEIVDPFGNVHLLLERSEPSNDRRREPGRPTGEASSKGESP